MLLNVRHAKAGGGAGLEKPLVTIVPIVTQDIKFQQTVPAQMIDYARSVPQELTKQARILLHVLLVQVVTLGAQQVLLNVQIVQYVSQVTTKA